MRAPQTPRANFDLQKIPFAKPRRITIGRLRRRTRRARKSKSRKTPHNTCGRGAFSENVESVAANPAARNFASPPEFAHFATATTIAQAAIFESAIPHGKVWESKNSANIWRSWAPSAEIIIYAAAPTPSAFRRQNPPKYRSNTPPPCRRRKFRETGRTPRIPDLRRPKPPLAARRSKTS